MPIYAKVDALTGEFHERDCGECGILSISGVFDPSDSELQEFKATNASQDHAMVEISPKERDMFAKIVVTVQRNGKEIEVPYNENIMDEDERKSMRVEKKYKIDIAKMTTDMKDRAKMDVPIEIDVMGGKEIIGYEQKPESVVTERYKQAISKEII